MIHVQIIIFFVFCLIFLVAQCIAKNKQAKQDDAFPSIQISKEENTKRVFIAAGALIRDNLDVWSLYARLEKGHDIQELERFLGDPQMFFPPHILEELPDYLSTSVEEGNTLLHIAAAKGHQRIVEKLCGLGVNLMHANYQGNTPLHAAALAGHKAVVMYLYEKMPLVDLKNSDGLSVKQVALQQGNYHMVALLMGKKFLNK